MTKPTRVQLKLRDSGSILYKDFEDDVIFHIEAGAEGDEESTRQVIKSFLRQHLLKNGELHGITPLMKMDSIGPLLHAVVRLQVRDQGSAAAVSAMYKTLGVLVSLLQQREKALKVAAEMVAKSDAKEADPIDPEN